MHIITLTSDWNDNDYYVASLKGKLLSACPELQIIDINHRIKSFNSSQAAFVVRNSYPYFPDHSIHIIAVNSEPEPGGELLAARKDQHFFLCADNGILGLLGGNDPEEVISLTHDFADNPDTFISLTVFARAACKLAGGTSLSELGPPFKDYNRQTPLRATIEDKTIIGSVIYIDSYQNAITNISRDLFTRIGEGKKFEIYVQSKHYVIYRINQRYNETDPGELLAIFNSAGLLEIAIRNGNAAGLLKLNTNSTIRVEFKEG
ncbi:MAG: SAM-dependent chlorinase/fluorinase [Bacteroidales bacterium]|nr:SAM-dependent chlorinase/fluorinase [Bacteroidales bacterium]